MAPVSLKEYPGSRLLKDGMRKGPALGNLLVPGEKKTSPFMVLYKRTPFSFSPFI